MTVKQHTPSGAQRSTSARTTAPARPKNTAASDKKNGASRKATADELTPERLLAILQSPDVKESVKDSLTYYVGQFYVATDADTLPEGPEETALELEQALYIYEETEGGQTAAARDAYAKLAAAVERHEPKDVRLVRRLSELLADPKRGDEHRAILVTLNDLSNATGVSDLHPDIFPALARVLLREARKLARGRSGEARRMGRYLRGLGMLAGEKGGAR